MKIAKTILALLLGAAAVATAATRIDQLPAANPLKHTAVVPIVQDGTTQSATVDQFTNMILGGTNALSGQLIVTGAITPGVSGTVAATSLSGTIGVAQVTGTAATLSAVETLTNKTLVNITGTSGINLFNSGTSEHATVLDGTTTSSHVSDFTTAAANAAPVQSVNGRIGPVTVTGTDIVGNAAGILKWDGSGHASPAVTGTDYIAPLTRNQLCLRNTYQKIYNMGPGASGSSQRLVWIALGDSVGPFLPDNIVQGWSSGYSATVTGNHSWTCLKSALGDGGIALQAMACANFNGATVNLGTGGTDWFDSFTTTIPSGGSIQMGAINPTLGTVTYQIANKLQVFFLSTTGTGTFKIQTNLNGAGWVDEPYVVVTSGTTVLSSSTSVIDTHNASLIGATATVTKPAAAPYEMQIVGLSGTVTTTYGGAMINTTQPGVVYAVANKGGSDISAMSSQFNAAVVDPIMFELNPDIVSLAVYDSTAIFQASLDTWQSQWSGACPNADFVDIGTAPVEDGTSPWTNSDLEGQDAIMRAKALAKNHFFFDQRDLYGAWFSGLTEPTGTHPLGPWRFYSAMALYKQMGLVTPSFSSGSPVDDLIYVDASLGNDFTGVRGRIDRPFATLTGALTVAQSGDTVDFRPGSHILTTTGTFPANVTLSFDRGSIASSLMILASSNTSVSGTITITGGGRIGKYIGDGVHWPIDLDPTFTGTLLLDGVTIDGSLDGTSATTSSALKVEGGTCVMRNCRVLNGPIESVGGSTTIDGCRIVTMPAYSTNSIVGTTGVTSVGSFSNEASNVTVTGTLTVGSYVQ